MNVRACLLSVMLSPNDVDTSHRLYCCRDDRFVVAMSLAIDDDDAIDQEDAADNTVYTAADAVCLLIYSSTLFGCFATCASIVSFAFDTL